MRHLQAFKYELMPTGKQSRLMRCFAGCCRFVFNKALALQQERHAVALPKLGYAGLCRQLTAWRHDPETAWLAEAPAQPLQQALKDLERAYTNFFEQRAGFPRFKQRGRHDRFRSETNQTRSRQRSYFPTQARLAALPQQPQLAGRGA